MRRPPLSGRLRRGPAEQHERAPLGANHDVHGFQHAVDRLRFQVQASQIEGTRRGVPCRPHMWRMKTMYLSARSTLRASNSSLSHPTPTPRTFRPSVKLPTVAASFASSPGCASGGPASPCRTCSSSVRGPTGRPDEGVGRVGLLPGRTHERDGPQRSARGGQCSRSAARTSRHRLPRERPSVRTSPCRPRWEQANSEPLKRGRPPSPAIRLCRRGRTRSHWPRGTYPRPRRRSHRRRRRRSSRG